MLYNVKQDKPKTSKMCLTCPYYKIRVCNGLGKACFEYIPETQTLINPITKLRTTKEEIKKWNG